MKYEPRLDEEYYLADDGSAGRYDSGDADSDRAGDEEYYVEYGGYKLYYTRTVLDDMDGTLAKLKVNMKELEDSYLEDSITEQAEDGAFYYNQLVEEIRR
jgi:hypothetical protein